MRSGDTSTIALSFMYVEIRIHHRVNVERMNFSGVCLAACAPDPSVTKRRYRQREQHRQFKEERKPESTFIGAQQTEPMLSPSRDTGVN